MKKNVAVVFGDAADYVCAVKRENLLVDPRAQYVVLRDETMGYPNDALRAPAYESKRILERNPEKASTWLRTIAGDWVPINPRKEVEELCEGVFDLTFEKRLEQLAYVLSMLGCRKISLESSRAEQKHTEQNSSGETSVNCSHGDAIGGQASGNINQKKYFEIRQKVEQKLHQEFERHDDVDFDKAEECIKAYSFEDNMILKTILDTERQGRKQKKFYYNFNSAFVGDMSNDFKSALKVACKVNRLDTVADLDAKVEASRKSHAEILKTLTIDIEVW